MPWSIRVSGTPTKGGSLATINYDSELRRAGANATSGWRRLRFFAQRYVLGTFGLAIMVNSSYNGYRYEDVWLDK